MLTELIILILFFYYLYAINIVKEVRNIYLFLKLDGPDDWPFIGLMMRIVKAKPEDYLDIVSSTFGERTCNAMWFGPFRFWGTKSPEILESVMSSTAHITKGMHYDSVKDWLKEGLLTSSGDKWHSRRKLLTPAFHFKILDDAVPVMNRNSKIMAKKLLSTNGIPCEIENFITLCTLDVICETAMGIKLESQDDKASEYVSDIKQICLLIGLKEVNIWYKYIPPLWSIMHGKRYNAILNRLHSFTEKVIAERKVSIMKEVAENKQDVKKRKFFLDCLIDYEMNNPGSLSKLDMREEVDTFMFEGHDTTSAAIMYTMLLLGSHPEEQEKVVNELRDIFGTSDRDTEIKDLQEMKYLEQVIKESLRLFPSVPFTSRKFTQDFIFYADNGKKCTVPEGTNFMLYSFFLHRLPEIYPEPEKFNPERFTDEEIKKRHPFAYIPFSAGPRNCIGQRFAMMELKIILSTILRHVKLKSVTNRNTLKFNPLLILRPNVPILVECTPRNK